MPTVLIVARTRYRGGACVGGLSLERNRNVRLLASGDDPYPADAPYGVGELWELDYGVPADLVPPHLEDVVVFQARRVGRIADPGTFLLERVPAPEGPPEELFDGLLQPTDTGSGYISRATGIPSSSLGFWLPDRPLTRVLEGRTVRYRYPRPYGIRSLTYVGFTPPPEVLPAGAMLRVSLARWWSPTLGSEPRCYLQLSGWFL